MSIKLEAALAHTFKQKHVKLLYGKICQGFTFTNIWRLLLSANCVQPEQIVLIFTMLYDLFCYNSESLQIVCAVELWLYELQKYKTSPSLCASHIKTHILY